MGGNVLRVGDPVHPREHHAAVVLRDGCVLITEGSREVVDDLPAELYDPIARAFVEAAQPLYARRSGHTATVLSDGRVFVAGGRNTGGLVAEAELHDPRDEVFTAAGSLVEPRRQHSGHAAAGRKRPRRR